MTWLPMESAPKDGTIIEARWLDRRKREYTFRTRWLRPMGIWIDWERQHVELTNLKGWRPWPIQFRLWTPEEESILCEIHREEGERLLDPTPFMAGTR